MKNPVGDPRLAQLQHELDGLRRELHTVRHAQGQGWLNQRRAEEVKALIHEVLADADLRASFAADGLNAGYDHGLFITDAEPFLLKLNGYVQFRYLANNAGDLPDDDEAGFQTRRLGTLASGYVGDPRFKYLLLVTFSRATGDSVVEMAYVDYRIDDHWSVTAGQFKAPFHREWLTSCRRMQAVERSYVNAQFTSLYTQGVELTRKDNDTRLILAMTDGTFGWNTDFDADRTDFSFGARGEWKLLGEWGQFVDTQGWSGDPVGLLIGSAVQYDKGERGGATAFPDLLKYTLDAGLESNGWNLYAAFTGRRLESNGAATLLDADQWGLLVQAGTFVIPDKLDVFVRAEWLDLDGVVFKQSAGTTTADSQDDPRLVTAGFNVYFNGHAAKLTVDAVHAPNGLPAADSGAVLRASASAQTAVRAQTTFSF